MVIYFNDSIYPQQSCYLHSSHKLFDTFNTYVVGRFIDSRSDIFFNVFVRRNEKEMKNKCYCGEKLKLSIFMAAPTDSLEYQFESIFCLNFTHKLH